MTKHASTPIDTLNTGEHAVSAAATDLEMLVMALDILSWELNGADIDSEADPEFAKLRNAIIGVIAAVSQKTAELHETIERELFRQPAEAA